MCRIHVLYVSVARRACTFHWTLRPRYRRTHLSMSWEAVGMSAAVDGEILHWSILAGLRTLGSTADSSANTSYFFLQLNRPIVHDTRCNFVCVRHKLYTNVLIWWVCTTWCMLTTLMHRPIMPIHLKLKVHATCCTQYIVYLLRGPIIPCTFEVACNFAKLWTGENSSTVEWKMHLSLFCVAACMQYRTLVEVEITTWDWLTQWEGPWQRYWRQWQRARRLRNVPEWSRTLRLLLSLSAWHVCT